MTSSDDKDPLLGDFLLRRIGNDLDREYYPVVYRGGTVGPGASIPSSSSGNEVLISERRKNRARGTTRPESGQGPWATARNPAGEGPSGTAAPFVSKLKKANEELEFEEVSEAYPQMRRRLTSSGLWLTGTVKPIAGLESSATLCVFVQRATKVPVAWAWWDVGVIIGPRHTNFGNGSICAFEPTDGTWLPSHGLVRLFDLYVIWIVRHMHLLRIGRWPGEQVMHTVFERLHENRPDELCGCSKRTRLLYKDCCRPADLTAPTRLVCREFYSKNRSRRPVLPAD